MRRILVPLDGTAASATILPDARRLAEPDGVLILFNEVGLGSYPDEAYPTIVQSDVTVSQEYLSGIADGLQTDAIKVETETTAGNDTARGIDDACTTFHADMIAVAAHARRDRERLPRDGIAWRALANSPVPVLIRHFPQSSPVPPPPQMRERRIMVPLDGSSLAERALPLARELAIEWAASLWLVHVVSHYPVSDFAHTETDPDAIADDVAFRSGQQYLHRIAKVLGNRVQTRVLVGSPVDELVWATAAWSISDVILSSHGRTGMARAILGSVADSLLRRIHLPMIVVPAGASETVWPPDAGSVPVDHQSA